MIRVIVEDELSFSVQVHDAGGHSDGGAGRYVKTAVSLSLGHTVLRAKAFHVGVMDSHRKGTIFIRCQRWSCQRQIAVDSCLLNTEKKRTASQYLLWMERIKTVTLT